MHTISAISYLAIFIFPSFTWELSRPQGSLEPWSDQKKLADLAHSQAEHLKNMRHQAAVYHQLKSASAASCYICGLSEKGVPRNSTCESWFSGSADYTVKFNREIYMRYCFNEPEEYCSNVRSSTRIKRRADSDLYTLPRPGTRPEIQCGNFTGGCFKRWIDLNGVYTERGCRRRPRPIRGKSIVSKRLQVMEKTLEGVEDGCVSSPMAILTPFSRAVSLFARYHVCVCNTEWCNSGNTLDVRWRLGEISVGFLVVCVSRYRESSF